MSKQADEVQQDESEQAVGITLLNWVNERGERSGTYGGPDRMFDRQRAIKLIDEGLTGEELYELLMKVSAKTQSRAKQSYEHLEIQMIAHFERAAREADSLSMYRTVQMFKRQREGEE